MCTQDILDILEFPVFHGILEPTKIISNKMPSPVVDVNCIRSPEQKEAHLVNECAERWLQFSTVQVNHMSSRGSGGSASDCFEVGEEVAESFVVLDRATTTALADSTRYGECGRTAFLSHLEANMVYSRLVTGNMAERPHRAKKNTDKLAAYKCAREGGKRNWKVDEDVALYDEVTEDQYKSIVRGRLQEDDFVVNDGVSGYMDNGMDDWSQRCGRGGGRGTITLDQEIAYRPVVSAEQEDDFMANLLGGIESGPSLAPKRTKKRKPSPLSDYDDVKPVIDSSPVPYRERKSSRNLNYDSYSSDGMPDDLGASNPPSSDCEDYSTMLSPKKKARVDKDSTAVIPAIKRMGELAMHSGSEDASMDFDDVDMEEFMKIDDIDEKPTLPIKKELPATKLDSKPIPKIDVAKQEAGVPSWLSVYDSLAVTTDDMLGSGSLSKSKSSVDALNEGGTLHMFWLDHLEHNAKLYLVGRVKDKSSGAWVLACLAIGGMQRNLFVLPRQLRVMEQENEAGETEIVDTDVVPERQDVYDDFDRIRRKLGIKAWKARWVKRKYAFDMKDVPKEAEWMKVLYSYEESQISMDACSPNIFRIFGTNTSIFEILVLKRKVMDPCWLVIKDVNIDASGISWCKLEANVSSPKDMRPMGDGAPEPPLLTIMSLAVPTEIRSTHRSQWGSIISPMQNERIPLNNLLSMPYDFADLPSVDRHSVTIYKADPDVLIGHDFLGVSLDVLLAQTKDTKTDHWSRPGRFRRAKWIPIGKQSTNIQFMAGHLLCDLASEGARSMIASTTWSLTEMCKSHLKSDRQNIDADDTATYFDGSLSSPDMLMTFVRQPRTASAFNQSVTGHRNAGRSSRSQIGLNSASPLHFLH
ncbi:ribonuclease H-like domain-containing protein [Pisolithus tinctorius]|nr:ribonuclease H-like domain-containing protein [Pisolithus tinctorius]